ncbi:MAG: hypothetical protein MUO54_06120, partial [Anaerolineales bacterium]|nr:hypothetical protein [Anaerolineales bacterium]
MLRRLLIILPLLLAACSAAAPVKNTITPSPLPLVMGTEPANDNTDTASSEKSALDGYYLQAEFQWVDSNTGTDIKYIYQAAFTVLADGQL